MLNFVDQLIQQGIENIHAIPDTTSRPLVEVPLGGFKPTPLYIEKLVKIEAPRSEAGESTINFVTELFKLAGDACTASHGTLSEIKKQTIREGSAIDLTRAANDKGIIGQFECVDTAGILKSFIWISPSHNTFTRKDNTRYWPLHVGVIGSTKLAEFQSGIARETAAEEAFRSSLTSGTLVSIRADHVPSDAIPPSNLSGRDYFVCALAIDVKDNIVNVQIGTKSFFVPRNNIYPTWPERSRISTETYRRGGYGWCLSSN